MPDDAVHEELRKRFVNVQVLMPKLEGAIQPTQDMMDLLLAPAIHQRADAATLLGRSGLLSLRASF